MDNNESLARVYQAHIAQIIIVWPLVWRHEPYGNWRLLDDLTKTEKF